MEQVLYPGCANSLNNLHCHLFLFTSEPRAQQVGEDIGDPSQAFPDSSGPCPVFLSQGLCTIPLPHENPDLEGPCSILTSQVAQPPSPLKLPLGGRIPNRPSVGFLPRTESGLAREWMGGDSQFLRTMSAPPACSIPTSAHPSQLPSSSSCRPLF